MPSQVPPADRDAARFRLPVEPPTRNLIIASLAAVAGGCQLAAWALARLPSFFLWFGLVLTGLAVGLGIVSLVQHRRLQWVVLVGSRSLTILRGTRREVLTWDRVAAVTYDDFRLRVVSTDGRTLAVLPVDRTRTAHQAAKAVLQAAESQIAARS